MANRRFHPEQPATFEFSPENLAWARQTIAKYPDGKQASAVIPLLFRAQEQAGGWLPEPACRAVAEMLGMAEIRVYEVATFYTMFQLSPVGRKAHVQKAMPMFLTLRNSEGKALVTAMLPPQGLDEKSFRPILVGPSNADPYPEHGDAIRILAKHYKLSLDPARCYPYRRG